VCQEVEFEKMRIAGGMHETALVLCFQCDLAKGAGASIASCSAAEALLGWLPMLIS